MRRTKSGWASATRPSRKNEPRTPLPPMLSRSRPRLRSRREGRLAFRSSELGPGVANVCMWVAYVPWARRHELRFYVVSEDGFDLPQELHHAAGLAGRNIE